MVPCFFFSPASSELGCSCCLIAIQTIFLLVSAISRKKPLLRKRRTAFVQTRVRNHTTVPTLIALKRCVFTTKKTKEA